jgi:NAD+ synthase (glutamine-hydrolysing)
VLDDIARETTGIAAVVGFPDVERGQAYNAAAVLEQGRISYVYHKIELPNYGVFDEERYFGSGGGTGALVFGVGGVPVCVNICEDIWHEGGLAEWHAKEAGARVAVNLSASPFHAGKWPARRKTVARFARRTGAVVCYANLVGGQDELVFDGGSMVVGPQGEILAAAPRFEEDLLICDVDPAAARTSAAAERELDPTEEVWEALVLGTRDYARKNRFEKAVVGLSGGVDSSLTACLAAAALGGDRVVGVTMPSQYTSGETRADAARLAERLGIALVSIPIGPVYGAYLDTLAVPFGPGELGIEAENLQARTRGNILMALSNRFGWLVLTTGNKSETAVGYSTLYGDTAGGFAVLKDVPKRLVYKLANYVNRRTGRRVIPASVIERAPSAELKPHQKDTDSLPAYSVLDEVLRLYIEQDASIDDIVDAGFHRALVEDIIRRVDRSEYKRRQAPPGIKITPRAFGRDRRLPITSRYAPHRERALATIGAGAGRRQHD